VKSATHREQACPPRNAVCCLHGMLLLAAAASCSADLYNICCSDVQHLATPSADGKDCHLQQHRKDKDDKKGCMC